MTAPKTTPRPRKTPVKSTGEAAATALVVEEVEAAGAKTVTIGDQEWTPADAELMLIGYTLAVELADKWAAGDS